MTHNSVCAWLLSRLSLRPALEPAPRHPAARHAHCPPAAPLLPPADPRCPIAPRLATPLCATPRHATPRHATPQWRHATRLGDATPQWHHETPRRATPRDFKLATPRHTTLRHATPCHATPRHASVAPRDATRRHHVSPHTQHATHTAPPQPPRSPLLPHSQRLASPRCATPRHAMPHHATPNFINDKQLKHLHDPSLHCALARTLANFPLPCHLHTHDRSAMSIRTPTDESQPSCPCSTSKFDI